MRAAFYTLGCKVNQYETQILEQLFGANGYDVVDADCEADVYVVNSCTVTASGDKKTRQALRRFKRQNPTAKVVLTGCFPQAFPDAAEKLPEADVITGSYNRASVLDAVAQAMAPGERVVSITPHKRGESFERMEAKGFLERTRAFVKIEDGCDRWCSYCIIPAARGPVRSKSLEALREELARLADAGYQEVVLVGINLSSYGKDTGFRLADAVEAACQIPGIKRVRLGSLEPELMTEEDAKRLAAQPKFCPQFHLSLQSGCDETLRRMNRHYTAEEYAAVVALLRGQFENPSFTTDIMVGFPGETDEEFARSAAFAERIGFAKAHVFAYSVREGTRAAGMPGQIDRNLKERRSREMIAVTEKTRGAFLRAQVGRTCEILFETPSPEGILGFTKNYTPVIVKSNEPLHGQIRSVRITGVEGGRCTGELAD